MAKQLKNMSDDELMAAWTKQGEDVQKGKDKLREFKEEHDDRVAKANARAKLAGMSDAERQALAQLVETEGIESEEVVNGG